MHYLCCKYFLNPVSAKIQSMKMVHAIINSDGNKSFTKCPIILSHIVELLK